MIFKCVLFCLLAFVFASFTLDLTIDGQELSEGMKRSNEQVAVEECCAAKYHECCIDAIEYYRPLNCLSNRLATWRMADCLHRHLFNDSTTADSQSKLMPVSKIACCDTFTQNFNDPQDVCKQKCTDSILSPSQSFSHKMFLIQNCKRNNQLFDCFEKCVDSEDNEVQFECGIEYRLKPGEVYIGEEY
ncbi:hypothetical protein M3Y96_00029400 [Aphelenchoides besseyi]|nr:hypothetical protein M3Y96_00029400 [Aphelenchoides besseyi]